MFLVGAGASLGSGLPDGATLATNIFNLLVGSGEVLAEQSALSKVYDALQYDLRLETFLEILADQVSPEIAFMPFSSLQYAEPCFAHFAILALSASTVITTNQDILFERAVRLGHLHRRIIHLHGRCNEIGSIVTTISQYLGGLERSICKSFSDAIRGRDIIVLGYSGRDRDIMPVLISQPNNIKWLLHRTSEISPELKRACTILGNRLTIESVDSDRWLESRLSSSEKERIRRLRERLPKDHPAPRLFQDYFNSITFLQRNKAIAKVLEHLGDYQDAQVIYSELCRVTAQKDLRLIVDLARVTVINDGHDAGRAILTSLARRRNLSLTMRVKLQLATVDSLRNSSRARQAKRVLAKVDQLLSQNCRAFTTKEFNEFLGYAQSARAGIERLEGKLNSAQRLYLQSERAFSKARDIDGRIDVLTWQSETAQITGDYRPGAESR